jgi:RNA polymerase sigma-70 factor, ECF subfamily
MTPMLAQRPRADRAFERMYRRYLGDVYRYALAVMRNPTDAEDVTQTTFLNAYRAMAERGERPLKPKNWLIAIAHNVCRQRFRQSARRPSEVAFEDGIADTIPDDETPTGQDIRRALGHLAFNQRAALVMRELEGRSYNEIAEILDISTSAVETLIFRARRSLREQLEAALTCGEAELAISRQLDGRLPRGEKGQLRAHLRECSECARFARRQRAQRTALRGLAAIPVPSSLASLFGGGGAAVGTGLAVKAAAAVTAGALIGGASYEGIRHTPWPGAPGASAREAPQQARARVPASGTPFVVAGMPERAQPTKRSRSDQRARPTVSAAAADKATGRGHVKVRVKPARYVGDASVAARHVQRLHVKVARVSRGRAAEARRAPSTHAKPAGAPEHSNPRRQPPAVLPGPYDAGPPGGKAKGK